MHYVKSLNELDRADLLLAGGKGAHLGALIRAGLPVPPGFCITTTAYRAFVTANDVQPRIVATLHNIQPDDPESLAAASEAIRTLFEAGRVPDDIAAEVRQAYRALQQPGSPAHPVAVRSAATAEDLPDLSFAGQQDTYLNVVSEEAVLQHMARCWGSLWTARAIGYRERNHIPQEEVALGVVVQEMVQSEASGVLFTANPLTGARHETVIDATFGLGEALVAGMVEPDHIVIDTAQERILSKNLGSKAVAIRGQAGGGTQTLPEHRPEHEALPDEQSLALARLGQQAAAHFGMPQDIEWAWADGRLYVLQSRAITSLYPLPPEVSAGNLEVLVSFGALQGMLDPITPLGQDSLASFAVSVGQLFGLSLTIHNQHALLLAGERYFVNVTGLFRHRIGRPVLDVFIYAADPASVQTVRRLMDDPRLALKPGGMRPVTRLRFARALLPVFGGVLFNLLWPRRGRERLNRKVEESVDIARSRCERAQDIRSLAYAIEEITLYIPKMVFPYLLPGVAAGQAPLQILRRLGKHIPDGPHLAMELTRGLPHNVTTEMDLALWAASRELASDPPSRDLFERHDAAQLAADYQAGKLPHAVQQVVGRFLRRYGARGLAEIDLGRSRWNDDPTHIFQVLKSYLSITDPGASPEAIFAAGADRARAAAAQIVASLRLTRLGRLKARFASILVSRVRALTGLRETPKFAIVQIFGILHDALQAEGKKLVAQGLLEKPQDIFFLHIWELKELQLHTMQELVAGRRQLYEREFNRRQIPRMMLSDGTTFYDSIPAADSETVLTGAPVSAGSVEGTVHVVLDPRDAQLAPGEILVCPGTDPAWTPLFLAAGGLVMEVGGMMTHGSVVAREYGIPAVVGVSQATTRLKTGQRVRVDGSSGQVVILD